MNSPILNNQNPSLVQVPCNTIKGKCSENSVDGFAQLTGAVCVLIILYSVSFFPSVEGSFIPF